MEFLDEIEFSSYLGMKIYLRDLCYNSSVRAKDKSYIGLTQENLIEF